MTFLSPPDWSPTSSWGRPRGREASSISETQKHPKIFHTSTDVCPANKWTRDSQTVGISSSVVQIPLTGHWSCLFALLWIDPWSTWPSSKTTTAAIPCPPWREKAVSPTALSSWPAWRNSSATSTSTSFPSLNPSSWIPSRSHEPFFLPLFSFHCLTVSKEIKSHSVLCFLQ